MSHDQVAIDLSDAPPVNVAQQPPSPEFMTFDNHATDFSNVTGSMNDKDGDGSAFTHPAYSSNYDTGSTTTHRVGSGRASAFLDNRGFGWMLDVDDDDDMQKPLLEELDIDLTDIYYKIRCVLLPLPFFRLKLHMVRDSPDFWGPLMVVLSFALLSIYGQMSVVSWILTFWFCGSFIVFFLARMLGGDVGYTQCLGIIGYCLIPLVVTGVILPFLHATHYVAMAVKTFGVVWAVYSAGTLLCVEELQSKRPLLWYPVFLLYVNFLSLYTGV